MRTELAVELDLSPYRLDTSELLTPALVIYPEVVRHNIRCMIAVVGGQAERWRPHLKTAKLAYVMRMLAAEGVKSAKCATTLELLAACQSGFEDILVAYPHTGRNARRIAAIAREHPRVRISAIVDASEQIAEWRNAPVDLFIDINTGMNRTGLGFGDPGEVACLATRITQAGLVFRGLHFYDGHSTEPDLAERTRAAQARYASLLALIDALSLQGVEVNELITAGTPATPCAVTYAPLWEGKFKHQVSPGTTVYNDVSSLGQLPKTYDLQPAALVVSRVVSRPGPELVTCDAGHKSVSVDSGVPNCVVLGYPAMQALKPSEEHLPLALARGAGVPDLGTPLYLLPRHVCPTVNNFDSAILAENGRVVAVEPVSARGHERPL